MTDFKFDPRVYPFVAPNQPLLAMAAALVSDELEIEEAEDVRRVLLFGIRRAHSVGLAMLDKLEAPTRNDSFLCHVLFLEGVHGIVEGGLAWSGKGPIPGGVGPLSRDPDVKRLWKVLCRELIGPLQ